eukprot:2077747-Rhodomonas_salina.4
MLIWPIGGGYRRGAVREDLEQARGGGRQRVGARLGWTRRWWSLSPECVVSSEVLFHILIVMCTALVACPTRRWRSFMSIAVCVSHRSTSSIEGAGSESRRFWCRGAYCA